MTALVRIGLIGDFDPAVAAHLAIPGALRLAAERAWCDIEVEWILTRSLTEDAAERLTPFRALWCTPGSPYENPSGALGAIRFARESGRPFLGTCGGFHHTLLEFARNVLGDAGADPDGTRKPVLAPLARPLVDCTGPVLIGAGTRLRAIYARTKAEEVFDCRFGPDPEFGKRIETAGLRISGRDPDGAIRAVELPDHPFFIATLFQPERSAASGQPHPLIAAFLNAAAPAAADPQERRTSR